jgi:hypothetical protein
VLLLLTRDLLLTEKLIKVKTCSGSLANFSFKKKTKAAHPQLRRKLDGKNNSSKLLLQLTGKEFVVYTKKDPQLSLTSVLVTGLMMITFPLVKPLKELVKIHGKSL